MNERDLIETVAALEHLPAGALHGRLREILPALALRDRFEILHRLGIYHHPESASGAGSTLSETAALRRRLPEVLQAHRVATVLDIPCGDFNWLQHVPLAADYVGADIVPDLVATNQRRHGSPSRRFRVLDATRDPLPCVDLVICRDLLIHLGNEDCLAVLDRVHASGSRLFLTNHYADRRENPDIVSGDFRPINLCAAPFCLTAPLLVIDEESALAEGAFRDRSMALWRVANLAQARR